MAEIVEKPKAFNATVQEVAKRVLRHGNAVLIMILGGIMAVAQITWSNSLVELFGGRQGDTGKKNSGW
jgi:hypothetical protein